MDRVSEDYRYTETETETETEIETIPIRKTEREILEVRLGKRGWEILPCIFPQKGIARNIFECRRGE